MPVRVTPSASVWEIVSEKTAMPSTSTSSTGMMSLDEDSMPLFTPRKMMNATSSTNSRPNTMGSTGLVMKPVKKPSAVACAP